jgi:hypothetical protein
LNLDHRPWRPTGTVQLHLYSLFNLDSRWGWVVNATPQPLYPGERENQYAFYRGLSGPQGESGQGRKIPPPLGFDPTTAKPVASLYIDCASPAPMMVQSGTEICSKATTNNHSYWTENSYAHLFVTIMSHSNIISRCYMLTIKLYCYKFIYHFLCSLARTHREKHNVKSVVTRPGESSLMQTERCLMIDTLGPLDK